MNIWEHIIEDWMTPTTTCCKIRRNWCPGEQWYKEKWTIYLLGSSC